MTDNGGISLIVHFKQPGWPLSLYLFALCMEWLRHRIQSGISSSKWNPIRLSRTGLDLAHLFFEDDLVIFSKENLKHVEVLKEILDKCCTISGHRVNVLKTIMFFSRGVKDDHRDNLSMFLGYQKGSSNGTRKIFLVDWGFYLSTSLSLRSQISSFRGSNFYFLAEVKVWPLLRKTDVGLWEQEIPFDVGRILRILIIVSIPPPNPSVGNDRINWIDTFTESFSVKNAYKSLRESSWHSKDKWWKVIGSICSLMELLSWMQDLQLLEGLHGVIQIIDGVFDAKLWGVLDGFTLIHERGYKKVVIHIDNLEVVKVIQIAHLVDSFSALLRRIHMSLQAIQHWKIKHVPREWNEVVDRIVKLATIRSTNMQIFEDIREELILVF
ncbi:hypothetical protein Gogos_006208 [Gossypium gossypioides]|uniref:RNase H type-1 domain-containing protein n=1 Tax=Gossypium gossypioides TaxID=34282 RepID=A0A7J9C4Y0_GOSGO|nr:hypothetical protein [Gossypium gossypioides]